MCIAVAMMVNVSHSYLWGPDEPREAEIARETLVKRNFVTPHLDGLPFLEKPPLYLRYGCGSLRTYRKNHSHGRKGRQSDLDFEF